MGRVARGAEAGAVKRLDLERWRCDLCGAEMQKDVGAKLPATCAKCGKEPDWAFEWYI